MIRQSKAYTIQQKYDAMRTHMTVSLFDADYPSEFLLNASNANLLMILSEYFEGVDNHIRVAVVTDSTYQNDETPATNFFFIKEENGDKIWVVTSMRQGSELNFTALYCADELGAKMLFNATKKDLLVANFNLYKRTLLDIPSHGIVNIAEIYLYFKRFMHEAKATKKIAYPNDISTAE